MGLRDPPECSSSAYECTFEATRWAAGGPYPQGATSGRAVRPGGRGRARIRRSGEMPAPIFGPRANVAGAARIETARATRPRRTNAETFVPDQGARIER